MGSKLEVNNLVISFRTMNGTVKAVRDISFDLEKGETLAIVGESGSGKSVTAKALMGIQAVNAINEGGEIYYDGKDLLKISEEDFHQIRGNRIAMIFQDPLSSLNPIMKIGKQMTEAMMLNGKASQRDAKREYIEKTALLETAMTAALSNAGVTDAAARVKREMSELRQFISKGNALKRAFDDAYACAETGVSDIEGVLIDIILGKPKIVGKKISAITEKLKGVYHEFVADRSGPVSALLVRVTEANKAYINGADKEPLKEALEALKTALGELIARTPPDYFALGYYLHKNTAAPKYDNTDQLNAAMRTYLEDNFLREFSRDAAAGIRYSHERAIEGQKLAVASLEKALTLFNNGAPDTKVLQQLKNECTENVEKGIDKLAIRKDSIAYTYKKAMTVAVEKYIAGIKKQNESHGKKLSGQTAEENSDIAQLKRNILLSCQRVKDNFKANISAESEINYETLASELIDHIKVQAEKMVYRVTLSMATAKALSLMEEVGIPEPRARFRQYPFQFSGGMRQRVVIAIALAANPDILICDEPTTALDVTIQAQILDLINDLKRKRQLTVIFITHDLGVVANMADKIAVMYAGKIVEHGTCEEIFYDPRHPYTWALLASMPDLDSKERLEAIPGTPPNMISPPKGDAFAQRNKYAMEIDFEQEPPPFYVTDTHWAATWLLHPNAPKTEPPKLVTDRIKRMSKYKG